MSLSDRNHTPVFLMALVAGLAVLPLSARADGASDGVANSPDVGSFRTERIAPSNEPKPELFKKGGAAQPVPSDPNATKPSGGIGVFDRMGVDLPSLPTEKPYTGVVDEAYGAFQRGYYLTAFQKALPRAQLGDPSAQTLIAELLSQGLGVRRDAKNAAFWYGKAAEGGDPTAMFKFALAQMEGRDVPRDRKSADQWMKKAADAGEPSAQFNWAQTVTADNAGLKGLELALPYYEKSAAQGIADAQYAVSQLYMSLESVPPEKKSQARLWLARAANAGFDTAQLDMGVWLVNGVGGKTDLEGGFKWMKVAAYRGNVVAQNKLAHLYINALGTPQDPIAAATWYVISRRAGLKDAELEDFYLGIEDDQQKTAIDAANKFRRAH
ncbi:MAG: tetratricopeptide repeat protein [Rhizobium sp.]